MLLENNPSHVQVEPHLEIDMEINEDLILPAVSLPLERIR